MDARRPLACLLLLGASSARADSRSFNVDHLQLAVTSSEFLGTEGQALGPRWRWRAVASYGFADGQLVADSPQGRVTLVSQRSVLAIGGAVSFGAGLSAGLELPLLLGQAGQATGDGKAALGDLRLMARYDLVDRPSVTLAAVAAVRLPTGGTERFLGEDSVVVEPRVVLGLRRGWVHGAINVGLRVRTAPRQFHDLEVGHQLYASAALAVTPRPWLEGFAEIHTDTALSSRFLARSSTPTELLAGVGSRLGDFHARAAVGIGLVDGFGDPRARLVVTLGYEPRRRAPSLAPPRPRPQPAAASPPPVVSLPPEPPPATPEVQDAGDDPDEPSIHVGSDFVELAEPIFFDKDRAHIHHRLLGEIRELARALEKRPWISVLWVEGHADATGPEGWNLRLSDLRAQRVVDLLVNSGVEASRLRVLGVGERKPWFSNAQEQGRAKNRRVKFLIQRVEVRQ